MRLDTHFALQLLDAFIKALSFTAGAMVYVVAEELIPKSHR
jgi:zinc transporter ZupT